MTLLASKQSPARTSSRSSTEKLSEAVFFGLTAIALWLIVGLLVAIALMMVVQAWPAIQAFGLRFFVTAEWNSVEGRETYGALGLIWGTAASSAIALGLAVPFGVGTAIFLSDDFLPLGLRSVLGFAVELLAAIPSVVYGLWGIFVLIPLIQPVELWLHQHLGWIPLFSTTPLGPGLLPASLVLALMVLPIITALTRDSLNALPLELRLAAMSVGATRWEAIAQIQLPAAASGIVGGVLLALGRALGETMAVTMLIGNVNQLSPSIFAPAHTIASLLANQFASARDLQIAALMYAALTLLGLTLLVNILAEWIINRVRHPFTASLLSGSS